MNLTAAITAAQALTESMSALLREGRWDECSELVEARGAVLADLESLHRAAGPAELEACRTSLEQLAAADRALQSAVAVGRDEAGLNLRNQMGVVAGNSGSYNRTPTLACVDRRA